MGRAFLVFLILSGFLVYATWAALQNEHYEFGPIPLAVLLSSAVRRLTARMDPGWRPGWVPDFLPFSPALLILPFPAGFVSPAITTAARTTGVLGRSARCTVGEPRNSYRGERFLPLTIQNNPSYFLYAALAFLVILSIDAYKAMWFTDPQPE